MSVNEPWQSGQVSVPDWLVRDERVVAIRHRAASAGTTCAWPDWFDATLANRLEASGIPAPWVHQVEAASAAWAGEHVAITTPTASGKSLAYLMPILAATALDPGTVRLHQSADDLRARLGVPIHSALYLAPTKALAHDQLKAARRLGPSEWQVGALDGDCDAAARSFARDFASFIVSNPDMIHRSVLPNYQRWTRFLGSLRFIVVDEAHRYRGVFGSHVSAVIRRLRRVCASLGAHPVVICASATATAADVTGAALIGERKPLHLVHENHAPHAARDVVLWRPQADAPRDATELMTRLIADGEQVITFVASRQQAELIALHAGEAADAAVASYRSGYLARDRRHLEAQLSSRELAGVAATNALELGIDIAGLDAVVITGFPGSLGSFWQQAGRAGRGSRDALVILVARDDPLDAHLLDHPELIFDRPIERTVCHPDNPYVLRRHLVAAAQELPLVAEDERWFGPMMPHLVAELSAETLLRRRPRGWYAPGPGHAADAIDLRGAGNGPIEIVDGSDGEVIGTVDEGAADRTVYEGAIYLHQGQQWKVDHYEVEDKLAFVHRTDVPYFTQPSGSSDIRIVTQLTDNACGVTRVCHGEVEISSRVEAYLRRDIETGKVWDSTSLDLPTRTMRTQAMWWVVPDEVMANLGFDMKQLGAALHAAEHTAIGLLPAFAPCDRWDIGGLSTPDHPDTGAPTVFVHDGAPGGSGFAERGFEVASEWLGATLERLTTCACDDGCPRCVVSPKCGNANQMLDKHAARLLIAALLAR